MLIFIRTNDKQTEFTLSTMFVMSAVVCDSFERRKKDDDDDGDNNQQAAFKLWFEMSRHKNAAKNAIFLCLRMDALKMLR